MGHKLESAGFPGLPGEAPLKGLGTRQATREWEKELKRIKTRKEAFGVLGGDASQGL